MNKLNQEQSVNELWSLVGDLRAMIAENCGPELTNRADAYIANSLDSVDENLRPEPNHRAWQSYSPVD